MPSAYVQDVGVPKFFFKFIIITSVFGNKRVCLVSLKNFTHQMLFMKATVNLSIKPKVQDFSTLGRVEGFFATSIKMSFNRNCDLEFFWNIGN